MAHSDELSAAALADAASSESVLPAGYHDVNNSKFDSRRQSGLLTEKTLAAAVAIANAVSESWNESSRKAATDLIKSYKNGVEPSRSCYEYALVEKSYYDARILELKPEELQAERGYRRKEKHAAAMIQLDKRERDLITALQKCRLLIKKHLETCAAAEPLAISLTILSNAAKSPPTTFSIPSEMNHYNGTQKIGRTASSAAEAARRGFTRLKINAKHKHSYMRKDSIHEIAHRTEMRADLNDCCEALSAINDLLLSLSAAGRDCDVAIWEFINDLAKANDTYANAAATLSALEFQGGPFGLDESKKNHLVSIDKNNQQDLNSVCTNECHTWWESDTNTTSSSHDLGPALRQLALNFRDTLKSVRFALEVTLPNSVRTARRAIQARDALALEAGHYIAKHQELSCATENEEAQLVRTKDKMDAALQALSDHDKHIALLLADVDHTLNKVVPSAASDLLKAFSTILADIAHHLAPMPLQVPPPPPKPST